MPLGRSLLGNHQIRVEVRFHRPWSIHLGGVDFSPIQRRGTTHKGRATHVNDVLHRLFGSQAMRHLDDGTLGVAVQQQITLGVDHDRSANLVLPIVVVGNAPQRAFNAAHDDGHIFEGLTATLAVNNGSAVWPLASHVPGCVSVIAADFSIGRVAVDHGVHVAGGHPKKQIGAAQSGKRLGTLPIGLGNDADPKALVFQHATNHRHAKAGVIDISVPGDQHDVAAVPTQLGHFGAAHGEKRCGAKTRSPVLFVAAQGFCGTAEFGYIHRERAPI